MKQSISLILCLVFVLITGHDSIAQTGLSIISKSKASMECNDQEVTFTLDLINAKGKKRRQKSVWSYRDDTSNSRHSLFRFLAPADVKGTGFLSVEHTKAEDDRWLFLPVLGKSRRISSNEKSDRFMGSDFTYEDLERFSLTKFDYELMGEEMVEGKACYKVKSTPNNSKTIKDSGYSYRIYYILKDNHQYKKIEYFNKKNQLSKFVIASDYRKIPNSTILRTFHLEMTNVKSKHKSVIQFSDYKVDGGIDMELFTVRNLEKV